MVLSGSKAQISQGKSAIEQRIVMVLGMKMAEKVMMPRDGDRATRGGCKESPAMCWLKCHEMSIDYIVEFDGLCMFMDVYVRYGFTIGHGGF